jgi:hypothetical protein
MRLKPAVVGVLCYSPLKSSNMVSPCQTLLKVNLFDSLNMATEKLQPAEAG